MNSGLTSQTAVVATSLVRVCTLRRDVQRWACSGHVLLNCNVPWLTIPGEGPTRYALGSSAAVDWVHRVVGRLLHVCRDSGVEELPLGTGVIGAVFLVVVVNVNPVVK